MSQRPVAQTQNPGTGPGFERVDIPVVSVGLQLPQVRTTPQSMWTKLEPEYLPTPPARQALAALAIWLTERFFNRKSAACPRICSEFRATPLDLERSIALVAAER
jgi:hypothetical protein